MSRVDLECRFYGLGCVDDLRFSDVQAQNSVKSGQTACNYYRLVNQYSAFCLVLLDILPEMIHPQ
jgi:hypothetical protein